MTFPTQIPDPGFYYHYKHDPNGSINNFAYEFIGVGKSTEDEESSVVVYRPLYDSSSVYKAGKLFWVRPFEMFTDMVTKNDKTFPRFTKITDLATIAELEKIRDQMYG